MQGPLRTAPGLTGMDGAAVIIKNAVAVYGLHLNGIAGLAPIFFSDLIPFHAEIFNHSYLVVVIKGNRGFALAAVAALLTDEYV